MVDISSDLLPYIKSESMPKSYTLFLNGDVAFADASEDTNDVAKAVEIVNCDEQQIVSGLHTIHGRDKSDLTVIGYKGYAFASDSFHKQIRRIAQGTKVFSINVRNFDEVRVGIPSKDEQIKIAKLLRAIDLRIATQNKIIEKLQSLIKGLIDGIITLECGQLVAFETINIDVEFLYYFMQSSYFQKEVERIVTEGTMKTAYLRDINHIKCPIPDLDRQKEISNLLSVLSLKEDVEKQLLQKYQIQKQYLLRQMFI